MICIYIIYFNIQFKVASLQLNSMAKIVYVFSFIFSEGTICDELFLKTKSLNTLSLEHYDFSYGLFSL